MSKGSRAPKWQRDLARFQKAKRKARRGLYAEMYGMGEIGLGRMMGQYPYDRADRHRAIPRHILHGPGFPHLSRDYRNRGIDGRWADGRRMETVGLNTSIQGRKASMVIIDDLESLDTGLLRREFTPKEQAVVDKFAKQLSAEWDKKFLEAIYGKL